ncbi:hypothetical protein Lesp02_57490 [Lentzea sp. NBRC 105346]|nr:hypothetical protein Lesp02_57490 [Lentzea sp. NBRC 105346]
MARLEGLVGRDRDLSKLRALVRSNRLVTLVGPGGVGKTRLVLELVNGDAAARLVELDSIADAEHLLPAVAAAFGADERGGVTMIDALVRATGERRVLLVLDNCEHLAEPCALLVDELLKRCPGLRIVTTSREALRVPGEVVYRVGALSLPAPNAEDRAELLRSEAVQLFLDRARAADPDVELTDENALVLGWICRRLDGLPLAIELAARRAGALSFDQILGGLHVQLLTDGARTAPARHRELAAAIEWSDRLLDPAERVVFRRLAVLAGGFDLAGATAVCAGEGIEADAVARLVCNLEAKSLVVRMRDTGRFRQLNVIRAYAFDRLVESGELTMVQNRAVDWLVRLAGPVCGTLVLGEELGRELCREQENLAAAVACTSGEPEVVLAVALVRCWYRQGQITPARQLIAEVLERVPDSESRGDVLSLSAVLACLQGEHETGAPLAEEAVRLARGRGCPDGLANALDARALALLCSGEHTAAVASYRECLEIVESRGRPVDAAIARNRLSWALVQSGEVAAAAEVLADAVEVLRADATPQHLPAALHTEGAIRLGTGEWDVAEAAFTEALRASTLSSPFSLYSMEGLAVTAAASGDARRALRLAAAVARVRETSQRPPEVYWRRVVGDAITQARGRLSSSAVTAAETSGRRLRGEELVAYALNSDRDGPLSPREFEIARLVAAGRTNREIAARLAVSTGTVATHLNSIRDKLGLRTRTRIALWVKESAFRDVTA